MLETITAVNQAVNSFIWGIPAMVCIIGVGLLLSVRTGFLQLRKFPYAIKTIIGRIFRKKDASDGAMTPFQAVCTALAATVGTGNIAGVAGAIAIGGPGAVFWMWCSALLGMCTKFSEVTLAVHFRERNKNGELVGGPMYYIKNGLGSRWQFLAVLYSLFGVLTVFGTGNATQVNTIVTAIDSALLATGSGLNGILPTLNLIVGVVVAMMVAMVLLGGVKRIAGVCEMLVPLMSVTYVLFSCILLVRYAGRIPPALRLIVTSAFSPRAALGAAAGITLKNAIRMGIGRGVFTNEAGLGTTPIAAAAAHSGDPVRQGLVTMTGTFIDTIVICTITGLFLTVTGAWGKEGLIGIQITDYAWRTALPWPQSLSSFCLMVCLSFFAFSTIVGWSFYAEQCLNYLSGGRERAVRAYRFFYILAVAIGPYLTVHAAWEMADILNALMALPNLTALLLLQSQVVRGSRGLL